MIVYSSIIEKEYEEYFAICQRFIHKMLFINDQSWPSLKLALKANPNFNFLSIANDLKIKIISSITSDMIKGSFQQELFLNSEIFRELMLKAIEYSNNDIGLEALYKLLDSPILVQSLQKMNEDNKLGIIQAVRRFYQPDSSKKDPKLIEKRLVTYIGLVSGLENSSIKIANSEFFVGCMNIVNSMLNDYHKTIIEASNLIISSLDNKMEIESDSEEEKFFDVNPKKQKNYRDVIKNILEEKPEMHLNITNNQLIYLIEFINFGFNIALKEKYEKMTEFIYLACNNLLFLLVLVKQDTKNFLKTTLAFKYNYHMIPYYAIIQQQGTLSSVLNDAERWTSILKIFGKVFFHKLAISDDEEFLSNNEFIHNKTNQNTISSKEMIALAGFLNKFVFEIIWNRRLDFEATKKSCVKLLKEFYTRDTRLKYCPKDFWHIPELKTMYLKIIASPNHFKNDACFSILELVPHMIPFEIRLQIFQKLIENDQEKQDRFPYFNGSDDSEDEANSKKIRIRRDYILEDGFEKMYKRKDMRSLIVIKFVNEHGMEEEGIDGGGLFKEFITLLSK